MKVESLGLIFRVLIPDGAFDKSVGLDSHVHMCVCPSVRELIGIHVKGGGAWGWTLYLDAPFVCLWVQTGKLGFTLEKVV